MLLASGGHGEHLRLKICDFGLSKSGRGSGYYVAASGGGFGACRWMAPESLRADPASGRVIFSTCSDVFAFGRAMLELVTREQVSLFYVPVHFMRIL